MDVSLRHTGIVVQDLDAAIEFYGDLLGFVETARTDEAGRYLDAMLAVEDARVTTVKLNAPGGGGLELLKVHAPKTNGAAASSLTATRPGITHIALTVSDLDVLYDNLLRAGIAFNAPPQRSPDGKVKVTYCQDPEGNFVELVEVISGSSSQSVGFAPAADPDYFDVLLRRVNEDQPELTFLAQFRELFGDRLVPDVSLLDIGCATGYGYRSFQAAGVRYLGIDIDDTYLKAAADHFADEANAEFTHHDILQAPYVPRANLVICDALLEHLPALEPGLTNIAESCAGVLLLRTFLGPEEELYDRAAPNPSFQDTHRKYSNQYAVADICARLSELGFSVEVIRDLHTESLPRLVDGVFRCFYVVRARRNQETQSS